MQLSIHYALCVAKCFFFHFNKDASKHCFSKLRLCFQGGIVSFAKYVFKMQSHIKHQILKSMTKQNAKQ